MVHFEPTPEQQRFIEAQLRTGRFRDAGEVLRVGLELWMRRRAPQSYEEWLADARQKIQEGLDELDRGECVGEEEVSRAMQERIDAHRRRRENPEGRVQP